MLNIAYEYCLISNDVCNTVLSGSVGVGDLTLGKTKISEKYPSFLPLCDAFCVGQ